jgi:hypothetical protein
MNNEMDLMQRLAVSKKIMEKHGEIRRGDARPTTPMVENYEPVQGRYNIPEEFMAESKPQTKNYDPTKPMDHEKIMNSRLPDEIKQLMYEHPIVQPSSMGGNSEISEEVIQGAQRLMNLGSNKISEQPKKQVSENSIINTQPSSSLNISISEIKNVVRDVVRDTVRDVVREELRDAGMLVESTTKTDEMIQFKVGNTLFVGKVLKIKQMEKK